MAKFVKLKLVSFLVFSQFFLQGKQINFFYMWNIDAWNQTCSFLFQDGK